jgi:putative salt-induced outer membrane protein
VYHGAVRASVCGPEQERRIMKARSNAAGRAGSLVMSAWIAGVGIASAQTPPPPAAPPEPPPGWSGNAAFGLALNRGNTATTNLNLSFEATDDPKTRTVWKFKGLYLRGENNGELAVDRLLLEGRNERTLTERVYAFGQIQFLEDQFKQIDYLFAPSVGIGYKLVTAPMTTLSVDGGVGIKWEKNPGFDRRTTGVFTGSDKFEHKLSTTATVMQAFNALWKADDFGDALYTFTAGVAATLTTRTQLKVELLDTYATRPPTITVKGNDVALLTALVYKFQE